MIVCFFFNDTATTEIYTLSLHDALPIFEEPLSFLLVTTVSILRGDQLFTLRRKNCPEQIGMYCSQRATKPRSEEHTSELQSRQYLVCRLLLEKKKNTDQTTVIPIICMPF